RKPRPGRSGGGPSDGPSGGTTERPSCGYEKANEGARMMGRKPIRGHVVAPPDPVEISTNDRVILAEAYQTGLIVAWKRDAERGYRLTVPGGADDYVEVTKLTSYLERLKGGAGPRVVGAEPRTRTTWR